MCVCVCVCVPCNHAEHGSRQQIFKSNGLEWADFEDDAAHEILEELLRLNQEKHGHEAERIIHETLPVLSVYYYIEDHGLTLSSSLTDKESIATSAELKKNAQFQALGLMDAPEPSLKKPKIEHFVESRQLKAAAVRIKALQYQSVKISTELAVHGRNNADLKQGQAEFDDVLAKFNEFAVSVSVAIAEIEGSEGDCCRCHTLYYAILPLIS